ncbi:hypothetical protein G7Y79_00018g045670 [Physcia stellaris]|nr:hypothetical protein G7Y79_00018g045670 [Physcia stellaris]
MNPRFSVHTTDKTSPRGFPWIWFLRIAQAFISLVVLGLAATHISTLNDLGCSVPGRPRTPHPRLPCLLLRHPRLFKLLPWWIFIQLGLDALMFIFWISAAGTSHFSCQDLCDTCNGWGYHIWFDSLSCECESTFIYYDKRAMSPNPRLGLGSGRMEKRRSRYGAARRAGTLAAREAMDAIMVWAFTFSPNCLDPIFKYPPLENPLTICLSSILFFITLCSTAWWMWQNRNAGSTTTAGGPTTNTNNPENGQQVPMEMKQDAPYTGGPAPQYSNDVPQQYNNGIPQQQQQQQQGTYAPMSPVNGSSPPGDKAVTSQGYPMAEVIGVVASGLTIGSLAIGTANSAMKLRSIWDQVQDAPDDILYLIEELEHISDILTDSEEFQQRNPMSSLVLDSTSMSRCLQRCKEEVDRLKELTDGLSNDLEHSSRFKKRRAAAKIVVKKDQINRALLQLLPDIIVTKISNLPKNTISEIALYEYSNLDQQSVSRLEVTDLDTIAGSKLHHIQQRRDDTIGHSKKPNIEETIAEYWTPSWIAHRLWRLRYLKSLSGWTLCFQTYNIIPEDSLTFVYIDEDNLKGLQELFSRKEASPFDCDPSGRTLLFYAVGRRSVDTCRFLIEEGADVNYKFEKRTALELFEWFGVDAMDTSGFWRLLLVKTDREVDLENFRGSSEGFSYWQQNVDPHYYQRPFEERLAIAFSLKRSFNRPDVVRLALSLGSLPPLTYAERGELLIHVAEWAGRSANFTAWGTAWIFDTWLESLQECGINLEEYGQKEIDLHDQGLVSWSYYYPKWGSTLVLTDLTYGPLPSDWNVTWVVQEKETPYIPGGWIGDADSDDEDGSLGDEDEDDPAQDEDEDGSTEEVYEDCSVGDEPEISAQATQTE